MVFRPAEEVAAIFTDRFSKCVPVLSCAPTLSAAAVAELCTALYVGICRTRPVDGLEGKRSQCGDSNMDVHQCNHGSPNDAPCVAVAAPSTACKPVQYSRPAYTGESFRAGWIKPVTSPAATPPPRHTISNCSDGIASVGSSALERPSLPSRSSGYSSSGQCWET